MINFYHIKKTVKENRVSALGLKIEVVTIWELREKGARPNDHVMLSTAVYIHASLNRGSMDRSDEEPTGVAAHG